MQLCGNISFFWLYVAGIDYFADVQLHWIVRVLQLLQSPDGVVPGDIGAQDIHLSPVLQPDQSIFDGIVVCLAYGKQRLYVDAHSRL